MCEEWWSQSERLVKKGRLPRTRYGLGYRPFASCESDEEYEDDSEFVMCNTTCAGEDWGHEDDEEMPSDEEDLIEIYEVPHQPRSFCTAANARHGLRDEQYLLAKIHEATPIHHGEILNAAPAPYQLEDGGQQTVDELVEINLGSEDDPRPTFVSATLSPKECEDYKQFLMKYRDCFSWSYKEMPSLDPCVATHKLAIDP